MKIVICPKVKEIRSTVAGSTRKIVENPKMKVAPKVILLFDDADGLGSAFYGALQPNLGSNLKIL